MKVLITGSRNGYAKVEEVLNELKDKLPITSLICGDAKGVDLQARIWAENHGIPKDVFKADWASHGRIAGPMRNQRMVLEGCPDYAIIFPGGKGTSDCFRQVKKAHIPYKEIK